MAITAGIMWSLMALAVRLIDEATTWQILLYRSISMIFPVSVILYSRSSKNPIIMIKKSGLPGIVGGVGLSLAFAMAIFSLQNTAAAAALFLFSVAPFIAAIMGYIFLQEKIRFRTLLAIIIALLGVYVMLSGGVSGESELLGRLTALLSAFGFAVFAVSLRWGKSEDQLPTVLNAAIISTFVASIVVLFSGNSIIISVYDFLLCCFMGCLIICVGMFLFIKASPNIPSAELTLFTMLEVVLGPLWVYIFLGEKIQILTLTGGCIVGTAVLINAFSGPNYNKGY